jgi:hypothetical protein
MRPGRNDAPEPETIAAIVAALLTLRSACSSSEVPESRWQRRYRPNRPWAADPLDWRTRRNRVIAD